MAADHLPTPPTLEEFEAWAGAGRVQRATELDVATWRLPEVQKTALISSGVPMFEELVHGVSFHETPVMYRLAYFDDQDEQYRATWDYVACQKPAKWPLSEMAVMKRSSGGGARPLALLIVTGLGFRAVDDAAGGQRGTKAVVSADLEEFLRAHWGVWPAGPAPDLGGSNNLNLLVTDGRSPRVARVYRPFVTGERVAAIQTVRHHLADHGVPSPEPLPAVGGRGWQTFQGRVVEVEPYVAAPVTMNALTRVRPGLAMLGRIHALLEAFPSSPAAAAPRFANYVAADGLVEAVAAGTRRVRAWQPTPAEARLADLADQLAETLVRHERDNPVQARRQLVHGDFWDNNVRFRHGQIALVTDFDFLADHPRVDDLALTLYFTSIDISDVTSDPALLTELTGAYESGLGARLSQHERAAIPLAMARQPLWSVSVWVALLDDQDAARRHLAATAPELEWARQLIIRIAQVQDALADGA